MQRWHCLMPGGTRDPWLSLKSALGIVFLADKSLHGRLLNRSSLPSMAWHGWALRRQTL
jgi:hypothetical protein